MADQRACVGRFIAQQEVALTPFQDGADLLSFVCGFGCRQHLAQGPAQIALQSFFGHVAGCSGLEREYGHFLTAVCGHEDDRHRWLDPLDAPDQFQSVDLGHLHVGQNGVGPIRRDDFERLATVHRPGHHAAFGFDAASRKCKSSGESSTTRIVVMITPSDSA